MAAVEDEREGVPNRGGWKICPRDFSAFGPACDALVRPHDGLFQASDGENMGLRSQVEPPAQPLLSAFDEGDEGYPRGVSRRLGGNLVADKLLDLWQYDRATASDRRFGTRIPPRSGSWARWPSRASPEGVPAVRCLSCAGFVGHSFRTARARRRRPLDVGIGGCRLGARKLLDGPLLDVRHGLPTGRLRQFDGLLLGHASLGQCLGADEGRGGLTGIGGFSRRMRAIDFAGAVLSVRRTSHLQPPRGRRVCSSTPDGRPRAPCPLRPPIPRATREGFADIANLLRGGVGRDLSPTGRAAAPESARLHGGVASRGRGSAGRKSRCTVVVEALDHQGVEISLELDFPPPLLFALRQACRQALELLGGKVQELGGRSTGCCCSMTEKGSLKSRPGRGDRPAGGRDHVRPRG